MRITISQQTVNRDDVVRMNQEKVSGRALCRHGCAPTASLHSLA